ncbi:MAG: ABC transporter permease, partial [Okeania sp. SIO3B3]|nr:ABC transporter permease [Okeania sp. SIO3B3]
PATMPVFLFSTIGMLAGLAGIIISCRLASAGLTFGTGSEMRIISACVIGGVSLKGGKGSILGAFLGLLLLVLINNALILLGVQIYYQTFITGAVLVAAVLLDSIKREA